MTATELRELDAWIAEHVMGAVWIGKELVLGEGKASSIIFVRDRKGIRGIGYPEPYFMPTTDRAAAMEVLSECLKRADCRIAIECDMEEQEKESKWFVMDSPTFNGLYVEAETLSMAVCLFAKKLFTK